MKPKTESIKSAPRLLSDRQLRGGDVSPGADKCKNVMMIAQHHTEQKTNTDTHLPKQQNAKTNKAQSKQTKR